VIVALGEQRGLSYTLFRPFNWIGPRQDDLRDPERGQSRVLTQFIYNALNGRPLVLAGGGAQRRSFTDIEEGIDGLMRILENRGGAAEGRIFNLGNPANNASIRDLALQVREAVARIAGRPEESIEIVERPAEDYYGPGSQDVADRLRAVKPDLHNTTDLMDRERLVRAIEIAEYSRNHAPEPAPRVQALVLGTRWDRRVLRERIAGRLKTRLAAGLIEEVQALHERGIPWERLDLLGLEYRFVAQYLQGEIKNRNDLFQKLCAAIVQFAKRQDTWFRRMERNGTVIHWIDEADFGEAMRVVKEQS